MAGNVTRRGFFVRLALVLGVVGCHDRCTPTQPPAPQPADGWHGAPGRSAEVNGAEYWYRPQLYARIPISREAILASKNAPPGALWRETSALPPR